jgi:hypothetical protein
MVGNHGLGMAFFDCQISKVLKETMLKMCKDDLKVITEGI